MNIHLSSRRLFSLCFAIFAATNMIVLSGVAYNRYREPDSQITLTERELELSYQHNKENSGVSIELDWRALGKEEDCDAYYGCKSPAWLDAEKLKALGFNMDDRLTSCRNQDYYKEPVEKEIFIVLENNGEAYQKAVKRAEAALEREESEFQLNPGDKDLREKVEKAEERLKSERNEKTRLFAIDAGVDAGQLRKKYEDRTRYIITKGLAEPWYSYTKNEKQMFGRISSLSVSDINVPLEHRAIFDAMIAQSKQNRKEFKPHFEVTLAYGNRWEPWIISAKNDHVQSENGPSLEIK